ncbi:MAG TPA: hypothetical protein VFP93_00260 [Gammaproteobacteria bacterium]|nr:hypothetical protein [Gammaproteobacteria bacterium]
MKNKKDDPNRPTPRKQSSIAKNLDENKDINKSYGLEREAAEYEMEKNRGGLKKHLGKDREGEDLEKNAREKQEISSNPRGRSS